MASFNKVILAGNLTRDPELRYTPKGTAIAKLSMAVNRRWTGEDGQTRDEVTYVDIDAFGKQAEVISQYLRKGGGLLAEGLEGFQFLGGARSEGGGPGGGGGGGGGYSGAPAARPASRPQPPARTESPASDVDTPPPDDDDVPF